MKTYKQFVVESNTARDNLYEGWGVLAPIWNGLKIAGSTAKGFGIGAGAAGAGTGLGLGLSQIIPWALNKTGYAKPVADFTRNIPIVGPAAENKIKSDRVKKSENGSDDPKDPKEKENSSEDSKSNPRCPPGLTYVPATGTSKHACVRK